MKGGVGVRELKGYAMSIEKLKGVRERVELTAFITLKRFVLSFELGFNIIVELKVFCIIVIFVF